MGITLLAACVLRERLTLPKNIGVVLSVVGVILCLQPWYDQNTNGGNSSTRIAQYRANHNLLLFFYSHDVQHFHAQFYTNETNVTTTVSPTHPHDENLDVVFGYIMATVAGVVASFANITIKFRQQEVSASTLNVYSGLMGFVVFLTISLAVEDLTFPKNALDIFYVLAQVGWGAHSHLRFITQLWLRLPLSSIMVLLVFVHLMPSDDGGEGGCLPLERGNSACIAALLQLPSRFLFTPWKRTFAIVVA